VIEVRQLRYAVLTADTRSFSRAATALNMKQATLSLRVTQLEDKLGIKLFTRSTRGAEPTEMGQVFLESARRIITDIDNLQRSRPSRWCNFGCGRGSSSGGFGGDV
jgi:DNA-binding transcriptional LysR family regulator